MLTWWARACAHYNTLKECTLNTDCHTNVLFEPRIVMHCVIHNANQNAVLYICLWDRHLKPPEEHQELNSGPPQVSIIPVDHFAAFCWQLVQYHVISHATGHVTLSAPDKRGILGPAAAVACIPSVPFHRHPVRPLLYNVCDTAIAACIRTCTKANFAQLPRCSWNNPLTLDNGKCLHQTPCRFCDIRL